MGGSKQADVIDTSNDRAGIYNNLRVIGAMLSG